MNKKELLDKEVWPVDICMVPDVEGGREVAIGGIDEY